MSLLLAVAFLLALFRWSWLARPWMRYGLVFIVCSILAFNLFLEYFFFEEFSFGNTAETKTQLRSFMFY